MAAAAAAASVARHTSNPTSNLEATEVAMENQSEPCERVFLEDLCAVRFS